MRTKGKGHKKRGAKIAPLCSVGVVYSIAAATAFL